MQRWLKAGCFEAIVHDLRILLRLADGRTQHPSATILDSRTLQSTPTSGARAGYDGATRKKGSLPSSALVVVCKPPANLSITHNFDTNSRSQDNVVQLG